MTVTPNRFDGRVALVTGGLGFIGSAVTRALVAAGARVRVLDSLLPQGGGSPRNLHGTNGAVEVTIEDTRSRDVVNRIVEGCDMVFHLAGHDGMSALAQDWYSEIDIACLGTLNVLEAVRVHAPAARVVFASSVAVYGRAAMLHVAEDSPTEPASLFGVHKLAGEKYCGLYRREHGLNTTVARLVSVFGPGQRLQSAASNTLAYAIDAVLHDEPVRLPFGGHQLLDVLFIDDAVTALLALACAEDVPSVLNIGRGVGVTLRQIAETLVSIAGTGSVASWTDTAESAGDAGLVADVARLRGLSVSLPVRPLDDALAATLAWYRGTAHAA